MRVIFILLLSISAIMETFSQNKASDRQPVAAGSFYPGNKDSLEKELTALFKECKKTEQNSTVRAIICPHAGYIYSGKIAAAAFSAIPQNSLFKNIFIIGSSHVMSFSGASVYSSGDFITPLGKIKVNNEIAQELIGRNKVFEFPNAAHIQEHSIEVQLPFIQYYFKNTPLIVPIIIGTNNEKTIKQIAEAVRPWFTSDNLFIISSDFSHYPAYNDAINTDKLTALSITSGDPDTFLKTLRSNSEKQIDGLATSMCGWTSGLTLLYLIEGNSKPKLKFNLIDYCNSGDYINGDKKQVVGYHAIELKEELPKKGNNQGAGKSFSFTPEETKLLFTIAKNAIKSGFNNTVKANIDENSIPDKFKSPMGAFVTLKINGLLRGCIGRFVSEDPLYKVVEASALSSAFEDPRFSPLTKEEFSKTEMEITVLGPLKQIHNIKEIVLGKHGIYIKKGIWSGTMLPQVAIENNWTVEQFLGYTSRDKAGIGWDGWKDAELFIYEGVVLEDNNK
jgi:MEMO1 family protein